LRNDIDTLAPVFLLASLAPELKPLDSALSVLAVASEAIWKWGLMHGECMEREPIINHHRLLRQNGSRYKYCT